VAHLTFDRRTALGAYEVASVLGLGAPKPWSEHKVLGLADLERRGDRAVLARRDSALSGAAVAARHEQLWNVEVAGDRHDRAQALRDLLEWLAVDALQLWFPPDGDDPWLEAARGDFTVDGARAILHLERSLASHPPIPTDLQVTTWSDDDLDAWIAANNAAFAGHLEQGVWTRSTFAERSAAAWFDPRLFVMHRDGDSVDAWCWCKVDPSMDPGRGEIYVIGVAPSHQGRRLGSALLEAGCAAMAERGVHTVDLFVESTNGAALALYDRHGFTTIGEVRALHLRAD